MSLLKKSIAECIGTFILVLFGCGVAIWSSHYFAGVEFIVATSLAFGLSIVATAYSIGNISGCHVNPAVSLAMLISKKMTVKEFFAYVGGQLVGALVACLILLAIFGTDCGFGANTVQTANTEFTNLGSNNGTNYIIALVVEIVLTFTFVIAILGVTSKKDNKAVAGIVIGLTLTLVHLLGLAFTGTSVNPARSFLPAIFAAFKDTTALKEVWIYIIGPFIGAALAAFAYKAISSKEEE